MKHAGLFERDGRDREETVEFAGLGLAGLAMVLFAVGSMLHFAAGLDDLGQRKTAHAPTAAIDYIRAMPVSNAPSASTRLHRNAQTSMPSSCSFIF